MVLFHMPYTHMPTLLSNYINNISHRLQTKHNCVINSQINYYYDIYLIVNSIKKKKM